MAAELVTGTSQFCLITFNAQRSEQLLPGFAGELFQVPTEN
jgi:hypothetical protein